MKNQIVSAWIFATVFGMACLQHQTNQNVAVHHVSAIEFKEFVEKGEGQLIDIRTPEEFKSGHIAGALLINFYDPDFTEKIAALDSFKPVYIYCRSGNRSAKSIAEFNRLGFNVIVHLKSGIIDWQKNDFPLVSE
jgi:rhodanese-related sulfurtransferase